MCKHFQNFQIRCAGCGKWYVTEQECELTYLSSCTTCRVVFAVKKEEADWKQHGQFDEFLHGYFKLGG